MKYKLKQTLLNVVWIVALISAFLMLPLEAGESTVAGKPLTVLKPFEIKDQFQRVYTEKYVSGRVAVFITSDRGSNKFNKSWTRAVRQSLKQAGFQEQVTCIGVIDLRGIPFFAKGKVKKRLPKDKKRWVLCDWKGHFRKTYGAGKGRCAIYIFDQKGVLVHKALGQEPAPQELTAIQKVLAGLLK